MNPRTSYRYFQFSNPNRFVIMANSTNVHANIYKTATLGFPLWSGFIRELYFETLCVASLTITEKE